MQIRTKSCAREDRDAYNVLQSRKIDALRRIEDLKNIVDRFKPSVTSASADDISKMDYLLESLDNVIHDTKGAAGLTAGKNRSENSGDGKVGKQDFTYAELENAWNALKAKVENDPSNKDNPPSNGYDIRHGYYCGEDDWNEWHIGFSLDAVKKALEEVAEPIKEGDLEVYWCDAGRAESDNHGIFITNGKIEQVY